MHYSSEHGQNALLTSQVKVAVLADHMPSEEATSSPWRDLVLALASTTLIMVAFSVIH
jgi:hypothetical protein